MTKRFRSLTVVVLSLLAFIAGWVAGSVDHVVHAQASEPQVQLVSGNLTVYYPERKKMYVYTPKSPAKQACSVIITLGEPGGAITTENCKALGMGY